MMSKGNLYVFTGPSGTGKGTILKKVMEADARVQLSVSATTRSPRPNEENGVHYWFLKKEEFLSKIDTGAFLEHACYVGNYYGTPEGPVNEQLRAGYEVREKRPDAVMIFVVPPSFAELESRLRGRGTETEEKVLARIEAARGELDQVDRFDYIVVNDDLQTAIEDVKAIFRAERCRNRR